MIPELTWETVWGSLIGGQLYQYLIKRDRDQAVGGWVGAHVKSLASCTKGNDKIRMN